MKKNKNQLSPEEMNKIHREFDEEITPHTDSLYNFALKMTSDTDAADDLVQETLLKAFRFFDKFERGTNAKAWLFSIMRNSYINEYRRISRLPTRVDYDDIQNFYENIKSQEIQLEHIVSDSFSNVLDDDLAEALDSLPSDFQTIIILADIENYTYEEIAEFMSCPIGTVRSRLHRARKLLYTKLYDYANDLGYVEDEKVLA